MMEMKQIMEKKQIMQVNKIIHGNCIEKMKELPDNSIDAVITDPPYNVIGKKFGWDEKGTESEFMEWTKTWLDECYRVLKDNSAIYVFFGQKYMKEFWNLDLKLEIKRMLVWHHPNLATPSNKMYLWTYDPIFY